MSTENTTVAIVLFTSKTLKNGEHPLMLRVTKNRQRKYVSIGLSCSAKDWDEKKHVVKKSHPDKDVMNSIISKSLKPYTSKVLDYKNEEKDFTPAVLIAEAKTPIKKTTVFAYFDEMIQRLKDRKQVGNAKVYHDTKNQIVAFTDNKDFTFSQFDYNFLVRFETYLKSKGLADNGISVRFRTIRALFNAAIDEGYIKKDLYPFNKFKISERFSTKTQKRAITKDDVKQIEKLTFKPGSAIFEAQQYFLFSYYGQGINFVDMANLTWGDIVGDRIFYKRAKTGNELSFKLNEPALAIINYWRPQTFQSSESYVFPILNKQAHLTSTQKHNRVHKVITRVNKDLKEIAKQANITTSLTSYVARHTFATVLKRSGVSTAIISESMGHQTEAITQTYLKSFENSIIDEAMAHLL
jgi:integrase